MLIWCTLDLCGQVGVMGRVRIAVDRLEVGGRVTGHQRLEVSCLPERAVLQLLIYGVAALDGSCACTAVEEQSRGVCLW
jgi:hypothetical protein